MQIGPDLHIRTYTLDLTNCARIRLCLTALQPLEILSVLLILLAKPSPFPCFPPLVCNFAPAVSFLRSSAAICPHSFSILLSNFRLLNSFVPNPISAAIFQHPTWRSDRQNRLQHPPVWSWHFPTFGFCPKITE